MKNQTTGKALLLIDLQLDFMPGGALAVDDGDAVVAVANEAIRSGDYDLIVASQDWHPKGHKSFASEHAGHSVGDVINLDGVDQVLWPDHCVQNSSGAEFHPDLERERIDLVVPKGTQLDVDSYSAFFDVAKRGDTGLAEELRRRGIGRLDVLGLATDYCVKFTVLDALDLGFEVRVLESGCRGVNLSSGDAARAIASMEARGAILR